MSDKEYKSIRITEVENGYILSDSSIPGSYSKSYVAVDIDEISNVLCTIFHPPLKTVTRNPFKKKCTEYTMETPNYNQADNIWEESDQQYIERMKKELIS